VRIEIGGSKRLAGGIVDQVHELEQLGRNNALTRGNVLLAELGGVRSLSVEPAR
jgi:hypothetical protein